MSQTKILVLDGDERASLACARALREAGYLVTVAAASDWSLAGAARGVARARVQADALTEPRAYTQEVAALVRRIDARVVIPITDASVEAILMHRDALDPKTILPFAPLAIYREASDKIRVHEIASEVGIGIVESVVIRAHGDPAPRDPALYPGVLKPHRSVVGAANRVKLTVQLVEDPAACDAALQALPQEAFPVLVQRRVHGPGEGYFAVRWEGRTLGRFAHRRLREKPPAGGVSVYRESIDLDPQFARACDALLDRLGWTGVAMVECKRDLDRGGWCIMEINGRFWGSLQLAIEAGVDFPALLVGAALGRPIAEPPRYRSGVRLRWEWGDIDHLLIRMIRSRAHLELPPDAPSRLGAIAAFLAHRPGRDRLEVFRFSDPGPFLVETLRRMGVRR